MDCFQNGYFFSVPCPEHENYYFFSSLYHENLVGFLEVKLIKVCSSMSPPNVTRLRSVAACRLVPKNFSDKGW